MMLLSRPFKKTWWIQEGKLLAGCYPGDKCPEEAEKKLAALLDLGIRTVINLQEEDECGRDGRPFVPYKPALNSLAAQRKLEVRFKRFPIKDYGIPEKPTMTAILDTIDGFLGRGLPVYVHCWGGHGRTGTVVGCWLVRRGMTGFGALGEIAKLRSRHFELQVWPSPQSQAQINMVSDWNVGE